MQGVGNQYKEFVGTITIKNSKGDKLSIIADKGYSGLGSISIHNGLNNYLLSEESQKYFEFTETGVNTKPFERAPTSMLSHIIANDIFNNRCKLSKLEDTYYNHS